MDLPAATKKEVPACVAAVSKKWPLAQRVDAEGKGTFDIHAFWLANEGALVAWSKVLRAVLCHVPKQLLLNTPSVF